VRARPLISSLAVLLLGSILAVPMQAGPAAAGELPRLRVVAAPGSSILVHGTYPVVPSPCRAPVQALLHARFTGVIEVGKDSSGRLFVINALPFEDYLKGIAEVPRSWPMEALKAQVVAARSYALAHVARPGSEGARLGYQICATTACQVYLGLGIGDGPYGTRWQQAVDETAGQVLLYAGRPADTLYFSTSNGHTVGNEKVFGSSPLPYLRPVAERDDGGSPVSHWRTQIRFADVARFLRASGLWSSKPVTSVSRKGDRIVVRGGGASQSLSVTEFRSQINAWAHCLDPAVYPTTDTDGRLPQTIPSKWFTTSKVGKSVVLKGRGWGHGVGMVQWGVEGKAQRGLSYRDILAYYYGGLRPQAYAEPTEIRVGVAVGLKSVVIEGTGDVAVEGKEVGPGSWLVTGGKRLRIRHTAPPPRYIAPAKVIKSPKRIRAGRKAAVTVSLPQLSVARLALSTKGSEISLGKPTTFPAGIATIRARVPEVLSGTYALDVVVTNGIDILRTHARNVRVRGLIATPSPSPPPSPSPSPSSSPAPSRAPAALPAPGSGAGPWVVLWAAAVAALVALGLPFALVRLRRSGRRH
jgi:stage II sporulation protein D (peptidoglycan lytic transglycosylase)